jgi:hypothetical protein
MENRCPHCGAINPQGDLSCAACRGDLSSLSARADTPSAIQTRQQAEAQGQHQPDAFATPCPDHPSVSKASRIIHVGIGSLAGAYGVLLGVIWMPFLLTGGPSGFSKTDWPTIVLFASAPVMLIVTGAALCYLHAGMSHRARTTVAIIVAFTALPLATKAVHGMQLADETRRFEERGLSQFPFVSVILMAIVVVPSGVSALLLGLTAIWLGVGLHRESVKA